MKDLYSSFEKLAAEERYGIDYGFQARRHGIPIVVLAPHGGFIEPGTSQIAETIAGEDFWFYAFEGLRRRPHCHLHITSERFDEPNGVQLIESAIMAVAIHGRADDGDPDTILIGGLEVILRDAITVSLQDAGFAVRIAQHKMAGLEPTNVCNKGKSGRGVQLELSRTLRDGLIRDAGLMGTFAGAVRAAIFHRHSEML